MIQAGRGTLTCPRWCWWKVTWLQGCQGGAHNPELRTVQGRGEEQGGWVRAELEVGGLERIQDVFVSEAARTDYYHKWSGFKQQKTYFSQLGTLEV